MERAMRGGGFLLFALVAFGRVLSGAIAVQIVSKDTAEASLRIFTREEIMLSMTNQRALDLLFASPRVIGRPKLVALLKSEFADAFGRGNATVGDGGLEDPKGYSSLKGAKEMLNDMMNDATAKLDNEAEKCQTFNRETQSLLETVRQDVASFNSQAADARGRVLKSQAAIAFSTAQLPQVQEELNQHNLECTRQETELKTQIDIVAADIEVMAGVLKIIGDCGDAGAAALIQCRHCKKDGEGYVMIQDDNLQPLLSELKSSAAKRYVQDTLHGLYKDSTLDSPPTVLTQKEVRRQARLMTGRAVEEQRLRGNRQDPGSSLDGDSGDNDELNTSAVPNVVTPVDCVPTNKCTLGKGSCSKIRDRFLYIQSGIQDMLSKLKDDLSVLQHDCLQDKDIMEAQLANLGEKLRSAQTDLAIATKDQVDSESSSNLKAQQHDEVSTEYSKTMKECCDEQNELRSEICALEKIRGELYRLKGYKLFITDCQVSDWKEGKCSVSCGGGSLTKTRSVLVHPVEGMVCPPLELQESCNTHPCPVDCIVGEWEGWSGCSAECGGGVRERMRPVLQEVKYKGQPCDDTEETEACNAQSCSALCTLSEWTEWTACSQACWGGTQRRSRAVEEPARGTGKCPEPTSEERFKLRKCNDIPCQDFYQGNFLKCATKVDLLILMDGSGSLGQYGWDQSKVFVTNLISNLKGGDDFVKVGLLLFSGPVTWEAYHKCIGQADKAPDMEKDCQIKWVKHLTTNTTEVAEMAKTISWPEATTLTSVALAEAEAELIYGRQDAASVVVVVTDGKPLSQERTKVAAEKLMEKARVVWVPVGDSAPLKMIEELASLPKNENIITIDNFKKLGWAYFANKLIAQTCPVLEQPGQILPPVKASAQKAPKMDKSSGADS